MFLTHNIVGDDNILDNYHINNEDTVLFNTILWCAALFCFHSFLLAGSAIIPAAITAIMLGYLAPKDRITYMAAQVIAIVVMTCMFKFTSAAIITAVSPYAVATLCAISMGLITLLLYRNRHINSSSLTGTRHSLESHIDIVFFVAAATFLLVTQLQLTLACAPIIIAAFVSFKAGLVAKQLGFIMSNLTKGMICNMGELKKEAETYFKGAKSGKGFDTSKDPKKSTTIKKPSQSTYPFDNQTTNIDRRDDNNTIVITSRN